MPSGVLMFIACQLTGATMTEFVRDAVPFLVALLAIVLFVAFVPGTVLFLANRY